MHIRYNNKFNEINSVNILQKPFIIHSLDKKNKSTIKDQWHVKSLSEYDPRKDTQK